jgi:hypothetical protein
MLCLSEKKTSVLFKIYISIIILLFKKKNLKSLPLHYSSNKMSFFLLHNNFKIRKFDAQTMRQVKMSSIPQLLLS